MEITKTHTAPKTVKQKFPFLLYFARSEDQNMRLPNQAFPSPYILPKTSFYKQDYAKKFHPPSIAVVTPASIQEY